MEKNILLVGNDKRDRARIRTWLANGSPNHFNVHCVSTLKRGLHHLQKHAPDLILLDLFLPDVQGIGAYVSVNGEAGNIPIVVLTPSAHEPLARIAVSKGAQDGLVKEKLSPAAIKRVVEDALYRHSHLERHRRANAALIQNVIPKTTDSTPDVPQLRHFQAIIQKQTRLFFQILGSMGEALILADHRREVVLFNPAAKRIFGDLTRQKLDQKWIGRQGIYLNDKKQPCGIYDFPLSAALQGRIRQDCEMYIRNPRFPGGTYYSVTSKPIWDPAGAVHAGLLVFTDVTAQRTAREELKKANATLEVRIHERTQEAIKAKDALTELNLELENHVKERTDALKSVVQCLQKEIEERHRAEEQIKQSLDQKVVLLQEVHHRVKNNLQIVSSLLRMQSNKATLPETIQILKESQNRIQSIALAHQLLYQTADLSHIQLAHYVPNLVNSIMASYQVSDGRIRFHTSIEPVPIELDMAIPCGMIITELISNVIRHAFPGEMSGEVFIEFSQRDRRRQLVIRDNGVGLPANWDPVQAKTLGLRIIHSLTKQIGGHFSLKGKEGSTATLEF